MNGVIATWMLTALLGAAPQENQGAAPQGQQWHTVYSQALTAARADRKPLLVVLHDPHTARDSLQQISYSQMEASPLLQHYHLCRIDVSTAYGKRVARVFGARSFPYTVITDRDVEKIIFRRAGGFTDAQWTETLADYRRGTRPLSMATFSTPATSFGGPDCPT